MNNTTEDVSEKLQATTRREARRILEALDFIPNDKLPSLLTLLKGLNCLKLGDIEQANRVLLSLYENDIEAVPYRTTINNFRISYHRCFADSRPKILTNALGGRVGLSVLANADTVVFAPGPRLARVGTSLITYRPDESSFPDILALLPPGWEPDYVLFFLTEALSLPLGLEASPYPVVGLPGDPWKANKALQDVLFLDAAMPAMKHMCSPYEALGAGKVLYTSCAGIQGLVPWVARKTEGRPEPKEYDVLFTGATSGPFYRQRSRFLWRLLGLADRHKIYVGYLDGPNDFHRMMERTKIVVHCPSIQGGINLRPFEAAHSGVLVLHEERDLSIAEFFEPGKEIVLFNEDNFEEILEYYITHDEERERIVARASERVSRDGNIRLCMKRALDQIQGSRVAVTQRGASRLRDDQRWNALGISDFYAADYQRAAQCFSKARAIDGDNSRYSNNLAVCLMVSSLMAGGRDPDPEIEPLLLSANREDAATPVSRFNIICFYRKVRPDPRELLKWSGALIRDLRSGNGDLPRFDGDELFFRMEDPINRFSEGSIFNVDMELLLLRFPDRGDDYQDGVRGILLWRIMAFTGDHYMETGQFAGALSAYTLALKHCPRNELILKKLSDIQMHLGLPVEAKASLEKILEFSPLHEEAHQALARVETAMGEKKSMAERLNRLLHFHGLRNREELQSFL